MSARRQAGLSLLEVVISAAIGLLLIGVLLGVVRSSLLLSQTSLQDGQREETGQRVANRLAKELRWADPDTLLVTTENGSSRLDYRTVVDYDGTDIQWSPVISVRFEPLGVDWDGNGVADEGEVVRIENGRREVLVRGVPAGGLQVAGVGERLTLSLELPQGRTAVGPPARAVQASVALRNRGL